MCTGTKSRMGCGHFHLNFHERCDAWCKEPQVQLILHETEQCGHCIAKVEVESSRANYGKHYNKEKDRLIEAHRSYCADGKRERLVTLQENIIGANREIRDLKEYFPDLEDLESNREWLRKEQAAIKLSIQAQKRLAEAEGSMKELEFIEQWGRDFEMRRKRSTQQPLFEPFEDKMELLLGQVKLMERFPQLGALFSLNKQLAHLESLERKLTSHRTLRELDSVQERRLAFEKEEAALREKTLRDLESIKSRLRIHAMEEKEEVKQARRAGRDVACKEPDSAPAPHVSFHSSFYHILKTGGLLPGQHQDLLVIRHQDLHNLHSDGSEDGQDPVTPAMTPNTTLTYSPAASESDFNSPPMSGNDIYLTDGSSGQSLSVSTERTSSLFHDSGDVTPAPPYSSRESSIGSPPPYSSRESSIDGSIGSDTTQNWQSFQSISELLDAETGTDGSRTPRISSAPFPPSSLQQQSTTRSERNEVSLDNNTEVDILQDLIRYHSVSPPAGSFPRHSRYSDEHRDPMTYTSSQNPTPSPVSLWTSGLDELREPDSEPQWMMSGAIGTSNDMYGNNLHFSSDEDRRRGQENGALKQPKLPKSLRRHTGESQTAPRGVVSGAISSHSAVLPRDICQQSAPSRVNRFPSSHNPFGSPASNNSPSSPTTSRYNSGPAEFCGSRRSLRASEAFEWRRQW